MPVYEILSKPRSVSCFPVIEVKKCVQPCFIKKEACKKKLEIIIDIKSRTRPCPPKQKCFLVKDLDSLPCCPKSVIEKLEIRGKSFNRDLNRRSSQSNLNKINPAVSQRRNLQPQQFKNAKHSVENGQTIQKNEPRQAASFKAEYFNQGESQKTLSNQSRLIANQSRQSSRFSSKANTPTSSQQAVQQQQVQPTATQQARLAQQQNALIQQQMAQLTISQHEKYIEYHSTMAQKPQPGDQLTSLQHQQWAQYHLSFAQQKKQAQSQQQLNPQNQSSNQKNN